MIELQLTDQSGEDQPLINFIEVAWLRAEPPETREYNFYLFNDYNYTEPDSAAEVDFTAVDLLDAYLSFTALDNNAQSLLDNRCVQVQLDSLSAQVPYSVDNSVIPFRYDDTTRTSYADWITPSSPIFIGDIPKGRPLDGTDIDADAALRFNLRIVNPADGTTGWARFAINISSANESTADGVIPIYDAALFETVVCGGIPEVDRNRADLHSDVLLEIFLFDSETQQEYIDAGLVFEES